MNKVVIYLRVVENHGFSYIREPKYGENE